MIYAHFRSSNTSFVKTEANICELDGEIIFTNYPLGFFKNTKVYEGVQK